MSSWQLLQCSAAALLTGLSASASDFLMSQWRSGALAGAKPKEAFFVRCDRTTMTQSDLDQGRVVILIGVAIVKPAEFTIIRIAVMTQSQA